MSEIQGGRWDAVLRKLFPVKSQTVAPALGNEIVPTMELQPFDPDLYWLRGERLYAASTTIGPVAGNFAQINLRNDSDDRLVIIDLITAVSSSGADLIHFCPGNLPVGNAQTVYGRDLRVGLILVAGRTAGVLRSSVLAAPLASVALAVAVPVALETISYTLPWILAPTHALFVTIPVANRQLIASFAWRERPIEAGELT